MNTVPQIHSPHKFDFDRFGMSDADVANLISAYRRYGFFRQEIESGLTYFSRQACEIYGVAFTASPANIPELLRKTHPDDIELVSQTFEKAASKPSMFHLIHRYEDGKGCHKFIRLVVKRRQGRAGSELVGVVYEFYEHLRNLGFSEA